MRVTRVPRSWVEAMNNDIGDMEQSLEVERERNRGERLNRVVSEMKFVGRVCFYI